MLSKKRKKIQQISSVNGQPWTHSLFKQTQEKHASIMGSTIKKKKKSGGQTICSNISFVSQFYALNVNILWNFSHKSIP